MKFIKESTPKGIHISSAALKVSSIPCGETVELHTLDNALILLKGHMTAPELLAAARQLSSTAAELLAHLAKVCGPCESCEDCEESCPYNDLGGEAISLPDYLRQEAGIPEDAKLCAEVNKEAGSVTISMSGHKHDLQDIPSDLLDTFAEAGTCLGELEEHMILEDIVYGG